MAGLCERDCRHATRLSLHRRREILDQSVGEAQPDGEDPADHDPADRAPHPDLAELVVGPVMEDHGVRQRDGRGIDEGVEEHEDEDFDAPGQPRDDKQQDAARPTG